MKNILILGVSPITHKASAGAARIRNYAKALSMQPSCNVFIASYNDCTPVKFKRKDNIYVFDQLGEVQRLKVEVYLDELISTIKSTMGTLDAILLYPSTNPKFEYRFLQWCKTNSFHNVFCEVNEIRRYGTHIWNRGFILGVIRSIAYRLSERWVKEYKGCIFISDNIKSYFSNTVSNSITVPILSDTAINRQPECLRELNEDSLGEKPLTIRITGTIDMVKENLEELFKGLINLDKSYSKWQLQLYGGISSNVIKRIARLEQIYPRIKGKIQTMGFYPQEKIPEVLSEADVLVLSRRNIPQNYYGFSTKLSEYMVSGVPVISTRTGVVEKYLTDGQDLIFVDGYDADGFERAFMRLINLTADERSQLAANGMKTAKEKFDPERYSKVLFDFLTK